MLGADEVVLPVKKAADTIIAADIIGEKFRNQWRRKGALHCRHGYNLAKIYNLMSLTDAGSLPHLFFVIKISQERNFIVLLLFLASSYTKSRRWSRKLAEFISNIFHICKI